MFYSLTNPYCVHRHKRNLLLLRKSYIIISFWMVVELLFRGWIGKALADDNVSTNNSNYMSPRLRCDKADNVDFI